MLRRPTPGFSLIELMLATAILAAVMVIATTVWVNAPNLWEAEQSHTELNTGPRNAAWAMSQELASAVTSARESLDPPVAGLSLVSKPNTAITFQKPLSTDETQWSGLITIRHRRGRSRPRSRRPETLVRLPRRHRARRLVRR